MLTPIRCFSCGTAIGSRAPIYRARRAQQVRALLEKERIHPTKASLQAAALRVDMEAIHQDIGLRNDCCRMRLTTTMDYRDYF